MIETTQKFQLQKRSSIVVLGNDMESFIKNKAPWEARFKLKQFKGYELATAFHELLGVAHAADAPFAIFADYELIHSNGFALAKSIRAHKPLCHVPIIAIAKTPSDVSMDAVKAGIDDIYHHPVDWADVKERVEFLHKYKPEISEGGQSIDEVMKLRMPLGKRMVDIVGASCAILALSPILLLVALLIKFESKGPIIYRSKRAGMGYRVFHFLKFRSMYPDADQRLAQLAHLNQYNQSEDGGPTFVKIANDPRVTKVGKFIRNTSIDELPQLFNILKGDMSLIGNRPLPLYEAEQLTKDDFIPRFMAPAGLTGLWQVSKRGKAEMSVEERIGLDVKYAEKHSMMMDMKIFLKTFPALLQKENV